MNKRTRKSFGFVTTYEERLYIAVGRTGAEAIKQFKQKPYLVVIKDKKQSDTGRSK